MNLSDCNAELNPCANLLSGKIYGQAAVTGTLTALIEVLPCQIIVGTESGMQRYDAETFALYPLPLPDFTNTWDIAHTTDKFWNLRWDGYQDL